MPHSTTWVRPSALSRSLSAATSATSGREDSASPTQASRLLDSASAAGPHRVWSRAAIRDATWSSTSVVTASSTPRGRGSRNQSEKWSLPVLLSSVAHRAPSSWLARSRGARPRR